MLKFSTKDELEAAWITEQAHQIAKRGERFDEAKKLSRIMVRGQAVYVPHLYRGGWVIREFGFSVDRIVSGYVREEDAGDPMAV